jgi:tRNA nucleotidyltransferase/poly(A) polymerase
MLKYSTFHSPHLLSGALREFLDTDAGHDFSSLRKLFPSGWEALVLGGLLRDLLIQHILKIERTPADVDIVISGANSVDEIKRLLGKGIVSTNAFGGVKCKLRPNGTVFDLWRVEDHTNMALATASHHRADS